MSKFVDTKASVERNVAAFSENLPKNIQPLLKKAGPILGEVAVRVEKVIPIFEECYVKLNVFWKSLEPYKPNLLIPALVGLILCFFGGSFLTLIAAVEAFRMCGYQMTKKSFAVLHEDFNKVAEVNKKDDAKDDDNDGVADVKQISNKALFHRKMTLFIKTVDPVRISDAFSGLTAGFMAVVATLKMDFAKALTLGSAIGHVLEPPATKYLLPKLEAVFPKDYKKWAEPFMNYVIRSMAITVAFILQRIISAFHSAIRGGLMFSRNILHYLSEMKYVQINHEETYIDEIAGCVLALVGLIWQLRSGFTLPIPLNILLFPFSMVEMLLLIFIGK